MPSFRDYTHFRFDRKVFELCAKAPSRRRRWSSLGWSHPGRIYPMIGGSGVDSAGLGASATVLKMFYSSGGGPSAGLAPDPFGIGLKADRRG